jgi:hypothetical protein
MLDAMYIVYLMVSMFAVTIYDSSKCLTSKIV